MEKQSSEHQKIYVEIKDEGTFSLVKGENVLSVLIANGLFDDSHCAGHGTCGKCRVRFLSGVPLPVPADRRRFTAQQLREGWRLACMAKPGTDCCILLSEKSQETFILEDAPGLKEKEMIPVTERSKETTVVVDLGTTTVVALLLDKETGRILDSKKTLNPQRRYGADVISRMEHALNGKKSELATMTRQWLEEAIGEWKQDGFWPEQIVLAGNTVMIHLFMEYDVSGLSKAPFLPVTTASVSYECAEIKGVTVPGISAFVGGDVVAGMLACRQRMQAEQIERAMLIDLGTNGELVLLTPDGNFCTATAAGPAFEGGFESVVYGVDVIRLAADLLEKGIVDETGLLAEAYFEEGYKDGVVSVSQEDIRKLQMAKAAIFAGIRILLEEAGMAPEDLQKVYLAGGFGYKLSVETACRIGLFPAVLRKRTEAVGNTALAGAYLYGKEQAASELTENTKSINLAEKDQFHDYYLQAMNLREERDFS